MQRKWSVNLKEIKLKILNEKVKRERHEDLTDSEEFCL